MKVSQNYLPDFTIVLFEEEYSRVDGYVTPFLGLPSTKKKNKKIIRHHHIILSFLATKLPSNICVQNQALLLYCPTKFLEDFFHLMVESQNHATKNTNA